MTALPVTPGRRSTLVTVVAVVFIALSGLGTLGALVNVYILAVTPAATVNAIVTRFEQDSTLVRTLPAPYFFMMHHPQLVSVIKLAWLVVVLVASIGVLRRWEWARRVFTVVLGVYIFLVGIGFVVGQMIGMRLATQLAARSTRGQVPPGMGSGLALAGLLGVAIIAILLWLLFTFRSARVRDEFAAGTAP